MNKENRGLDRLRAHLHRGAGSRLGGPGSRPPGGRVRKGLRRAGIQRRRRAQLEPALEFVRDGDTLVVAKADRLARGVADLLGIVARLEAKRVALRILSLGGSRA